MAKQETEGRMEVSHTKGGLKVMVPSVVATALLTVAGSMAVGNWRAKANQPQPESVQQQTVPYLVERGPVVTGMKRDDERLRQDLGDTMKQQQADHDAITSLRSDVRHIKETVDEIKQAVTKRPGP